MHMPATALECTQHTRPARCGLPQDSRAERNSTILFFVTSARRSLRADGVTSPLTTHHSPLITASTSAHARWSMARPRLPPDLRAA